jgi:acetyl esterase/lipase
MSFLNGLFELLKKLILFVLIVAIVVPLRYGSTDYRHLRIRLLHSLLSLKYSIVSDQARPTLTADYRAFESLLRMRPLLNIDPSEDALALIKKLRLSFSSSNLIPKPSQCQIKKEVFEHDGHSVDGYWIDNHQNQFQKNSDKILLYFHGGGYLFGDIHGKNLSTL